MQNSKSIIWTTLALSLFWLLTLTIRFGTSILCWRELDSMILHHIPEKFFIYYEESDWSARIIKAGYTIYYQAKGLIYHKESMTMGKESAIKVYYHTRNRILYMRRNTNFFQFLVFITFFILFTAPKAIFRYLFKKQFEHLKSFVKGVLWNFTTSKYSPV